MESTTAASADCWQEIWTWNFDATLASLKVSSWTPSTQGSVRSWSFRRRWLDAPSCRKKSGGSHRRKGCGSLLECGRKPVAFADAEISNPAAACYKSHGFDTVDVLNELLGDLEAELNHTRRAESDVAHNLLSSGSLLTVAAGQQV